MTERLPQSYQQITDIIQILRRVHAELSMLSKATGVTLGETRAGLLLATLSNRQQQMVDFLETSQSGATEKVLATWIQFVPIERIEQLLQEMQATTVVGEDLPEYILKTQQEIAALIPVVQDESAAEEVNEFLQALADREHAEAKLSSEAALGMDDV